MAVRRSSKISTVNIIRDLQYKQAPVFGQDLNLSIDLRLQFLAYRELKSAIVSHGAKSGSLVILEVKVVKF